MFMNIFDALKHNMLACKQYHFCYNLVLYPDKYDWKTATNIAGTFAAWDVYAHEILQRWLSCKLSEEENFYERGEVSLKIDKLDLGHKLR